MIKKGLLVLVSFIVSLVVISLIPFETFINNQTARDAIIVISSLLLTLAIYRIAKPKLIKEHFINAT